MREFSTVVLGAGGVGKSALVVRFVKHEFVEHYNPTIEEQYQAQITLDGEQFALDILDTAGAEQFNALSEVYIKSGDGFIVVFSLTHEASLREVDDIRQQIYRIKGEDARTPIVVVGTKMDLANEREVTRAKIRELASLWGLPFYETSAKKNWHVSTVFEDLLHQMRKRYRDDSQHGRMKKKSKRECLIM